MASRRASTAESTREMKNDATDEMSDEITLGGLEPARYASMTSS